jgi:hypothetical protein
LRALLRQTLAAPQGRSRVDGKLGNKYYVMAWPLKGGEAIEIGERCYYDGEQITAEMVAKEFAKETPPSVELIVQPPGGRTLVNFDTVYSTQAEAYVKPVRLLGETVEFDGREGTGLRSTAR